MKKDKAKKNKSNTIKSSGFLLYFLVMGIFFFSIVMIFYSMSSSSKHRILRVKNRHVSLSLAETGLDYALYMMTEHNWKPNKISPCPGQIYGELEKIDGRILLREYFQTPEITEPGGYSIISLYSYEGGFVKIRSEGFIGRQKAVIEKDVEFYGFTSEDSVDEEQVYIIEEDLLEEDTLEPLSEIPLQNREEEDSLKNNETDL